jgi:hypothetical protein
LALSAVALLGMFSHQAAATEEIVVYGAEVAATAVLQEAVFRSEIDAYVRSLNEQIKVTLDNDLRRVSAPKLILAESETGIRG